MATRWRCPPTELVGAAVEEPVEAEQRGHLLHAALGLGLRAAAHLEAEADVLLHREVREHGGLLEHHRHVPPTGREVRDGLAVDPDLARGEVFQPGHQAQDRGLPAARRADQGDHLAVVHLQRHLAHGGDVPPVDLGDLVELQRCHQARPVTFTLSITQRWASRNIATIGRM